MENIFILETEDRSNVVLNPIDKDLKRVLKYNPSKIQIGQGVDNQLIYITNEEKPNLYAIGKDGGIDKVLKYPLNNGKNRNIVLTNDPKLIADGVQELTEEQLKEIVCRYPLDYVEVKKEIKAFDNLSREIDFAMENDDYTKSVYSLVFNSFSAEKQIKTEEKC